MNNIKGMMSSYRARRHAGRLQGDEPSRNRSLGLSADEKYSFYTPRRTKNAKRITLWISNKIVCSALEPRQHMRV
jgi:hypothetical protein